MPTSVKERSLRSFITAASTLFLTNRKLKQIMKFSKPIQQKKKKKKNNKELENQYLLEKLILREKEL